MTIRKLALAAVMLCACGVAKADWIASEAVRLDSVETINFLLTKRDSHDRGRCLDIKGAKDMSVNVTQGGRWGNQYPGCYQHLAGGKIGVYFWEFDEKDRVYMERDLSKFEKTSSFTGW